MRSLEAFVKQTRDELMHDIEVEGSKVSEVEVKSRRLAERAKKHMDDAFEEVVS